jgi:2-dehydropantoate 2-reductase
VSPRFCVAGAGAIGGTLAGQLAAAGYPVSILGRRGAHCDAIRANGLTVWNGESSVTTRLPVAEHSEELEPVDFVLACVKAHDLPTLAGQLNDWTGSDTEIAVIANGVPWWVPSVTRDPSQQLECMDPTGTLLKEWPPDRVLAGVAHFTAAVVEPGVIQRGKGRQLLIGSPTGTRSAAASALSRALGSAGFDALARQDILSDIWVKLLGNLNLNPISALTGATVDVVLADPLVHELAVQMHHEGQRVGRALGIPVTMDPEERLAMANELGAFRTSMLQDFDSGKPMELDAIAGAVVELASLAGVSCPAVRSVLGLLRLRASTRNSELVR